MAATLDALRADELRALEERAARLTYRVLGLQGSATDPEKLSIGTGFAITDGHLVTCAHVVAAACGRSKVASWLKDPVPLDTQVTVQQADPYARPTTARVRFYCPHAANDELRDVAILELDEPTPAMVAFSAADVSYGTQLRAFGYPAGHKRTGGFVDLQTAGPDNLGWLQVDKSKSNGVPLRGGISGSPVWQADLSAVVGLISMAEEDTGVAHVIPYSHIRAAAESIRCLPRVVGGAQSVFESLMKLDFTQQLTAVASLVEQKMLAILLTGEDKYGHRVLLERIKRRIRLEKVSMIRVDLGRVTIRSSANRVHVDVGQQVGVPDGQPQKVYSAIAQRIQYEDVVLLFWPGALTPADVIQEVVSSFWKPLVCAVSASLRPKKRLFGIILDEYARRSQWGELEVATDLAKWRPDIPFELPQLSRIDAATLQNWVLDSTDGFAQMLSPVLAVDELLRQSQDGIPEQVFECYCKMRALQWIDVKEQWLRS